MLFSCILYHQDDLMHTQRFICFLSCNSNRRLKNLCRTGAYGLLVLFYSIKQVKNPCLAEGSRTSNITSACLRGQFCNSIWVWELVDSLFGAFICGWKICAINIPRATPQAPSMNHLVLSERNENIVWTWIDCRP